MPTRPWPSVVLNGAANAGVAVGGVAEDTVRNIERVQGGSANDVLTGDGLANELRGLAGSDVLAGGAGNDVLVGGIGNDQFVFHTALNASTNVDTIADFNVANDTIQLENAIFTAIAGTGTLTAAQFAANATGTAQDAGDRIVYETDTGNLFYDSNGSAAGGSVQFATLSMGLGLTNQDDDVKNLSQIWAVAPALVKLALRDDRRSQFNKEPPWKRIAEGPSSAM
jgi:Ca2+-binding RTX toxin-like protein